MKCLLLLILSCAPAMAQNDLSKILVQGLESAVKTLQPVPEKDRGEILTATAALLSKHVTFRPDGTASSYDTQSGRRPVEWKKFVVSSITAQPVTEADRLNGVAKRYLVGFGCDCHRTWDSMTNHWGPWLSVGHSAFPSSVNFELKGGAWNACESVLLKNFQPGPGPSITDGKRSGKDAGLPPGMSRVK